MVGLAWSDDPESYAGGSLAAGRVFHAVQVKGDDADKKGYLGPPGWGLGVGSYEDYGKDSDLEHGMLEQCSDLDRNARTGILRGF